MSYSLLKLAGLGGLVVAAGGGMVLGTMKFSSTEKSTPKVIGTVVQRKNPVLSSVPIPEGPACIIYEAKKRDGVDEFTEILRKFENKEEFFKELQTRQSVNDNALKAELDDACNNRNGKKNINGHVYLWYGPNGQGKNTWFYATRMHDKGIDWSNRAIKTYETRNPQTH
ncbi:hypothetical protein MHC_04255 [Mycoplasma haemocanis str. Illinois]|uniref:Uncharacterized protein n=1 Tax=Mycoplasma haemocanis (strain Illinois) TaxID=1111676 RepID=H6N7T5_MYCHN|nr:hypothetical protein [Mycoplasma haemocanis]AEW45707.1 hypothetical protein MHC_04255 [Mycoplasma haemocanis str. Illinois]